MGPGCSLARADDSCWERTAEAPVVGGRRRPTGYASTARPTPRTEARWKPALAMPDSKACCTLLRTSAVPEICSHQFAV